jgi:hypothetical protein
VELQSQFSSGCIACLFVLLMHYQVALLDLIHGLTLHRHGVRC